MYETPITRRTALGGAVAAATTLALPNLARAGGPTSRGFRYSLSVSPFTETVLAQTAITDGKVTARTVQALQQMYVSYGATEVYARIATRKRAPQFGGTDAEHGWARGLQRARLAEELGLPFNPEIGLFGNYGDGGSWQTPPDFADYPQIKLPAPWLELTLAQMLPIIRQYTAIIAEQILSTGVTVNVWDLGNEVEQGIAGVCTNPFLPDGRYVPPDKVDPAIGQRNGAEQTFGANLDRISWAQQHLWPYLAQMLGAAADGVRSVDPEAKFSTHTGFETVDYQLAFWQSMKDEGGYLPDQFGTSYYPTFPPTPSFEGSGETNYFQALKDVAAGLHAKFGRPIFIAEYGYPSAPLTGAYPFDNPVPGYPLNETGQRDFTRDLVGWGTRSGLLAGLRPWAPDYVTSGWEPMAWFETPDSRLAAPKPAFTAVNEVIGLPTHSRRGLRLRSIRRSGSHAVVVTLGSSARTIRNVRVQLRHGSQVLAHRIVTVSGESTQVVLTTRRPLRRGLYTVRISSGSSVITGRIVVR